MNGVPLSTNEDLCKGGKSDLSIAIPAGTIAADGYVDIEFEREGNDATPKEFIIREFLLGSGPYL